jgi:hypothetical protein
VLNLLTTTLILTGAIGCVTVYIAWQQAEIARNKLRLDLFDRRWVVFEAVMKLASIVLEKADIRYEQIRDFSIATKGVQFLFDQKLYDYCSELRKEALAVMAGNKEMEPLAVGEKRTKIAAYLNQRLLWFSDQLDEIPKRFAPFLKIRG